MYGCVLVTYQAKRYQKATMHVAYLGSYSSTVQLAIHVANLVLKCWYPLASIYIYVAIRKSESDVMGFDFCSCMIMGRGKWVNVRFCW